MASIMSNKPFNGIYWKKKDGILQCSGPSEVGHWRASGLPIYNLLGFVDFVQENDCESQVHGIKIKTCA